METKSRTSLRPRLAHAVRMAVIAVFGLSALPPLARAVGLLDWGWPAALASLTVAGGLISLLVIGVVSSQAVGWARRRLAGDRDAGTLTPPPERLEPPKAAEEAGERILAQHPEILAAICHGLRFGKQVRSVLGRPVSDPWGVYAAAVEASALELGELSHVAARHTHRFAQSGRKKGGRGRTPSDSVALKEAVKAFGSCAAKSEAGRRDPDCTFEHVTTMFGARTPARDMHLKTIAPRVRRVLEAEYPQLATAELADGSRVKFAQWKEAAARDRQELAKARKELRRVNRKPDEKQDEVDMARREIELLRRSLDADRKRATEEARAEQARAVEGLREALEEQRTEHERESARLAGELTRLEAHIEELTRERDELEEALFRVGEGSEGEAEPFDTAALNGLRILLVGGHPGQIPPLREHLESFGVQLLHEDRPGAAELVAGVHAAVLWVRFVSHPTAHAVKRECRVRGVPCAYWSRTSPESLVALVAETAAGGVADAVEGA